MQVYKRGIMSMMLGILGAHVAGFLVYALLSVFIAEIWSALIGFIIYLAILYIIIFSDNIKFTLDENAKIFSYYQNKKLVQEYDLRNVTLSYKMVTGKSGNTLDLFINEDRIDCEPLGIRTFDKMYANLEEVAGVQPISLKVGSGVETRSDTTILRPGNRKS